MPNPDLGIVEETLRRFISTDVDYDIHKEFEEEGSYPALAEEFIRVLADVIDETDGVDLDDF